METTETEVELPSYPKSREKWQKGPEGERESQLLEQHSTLGHP